MYLCGKSSTLQQLPDDRRGPTAAGLATRALALPLITFAFGQVAVALLVAGLAAPQVDFETVRAESS